MNALSPDPIQPAMPVPSKGLPVAALVERLDPAARAAFHHELRRGRTEIEALTFSVVIPDALEALWHGRSRR